MARYHGLVIWQEAMHVLRLVHEDLPSIRSDWHLHDQLKRAARDTAALICEGSSARTKREFRRYVGMARASNSEVQGWYDVAGAEDLILPERVRFISGEVERCGRRMTVFMRSLCPDY